MQRGFLKEHSEAVFLPMDKEHYDSISSRIMEILRQESDLFEQVSIDEAYLDVTRKTQAKYSNAIELAEKIKSVIKEAESLTCSVGISSNKLLAKMAADSHKPDGLTLIEPSRVHDFLVDLPLGKLMGIGPKTEEKLQSLGIKSVKDLAAFEDESLLVEQFGKKLGPHLKMIAQGIDNSPVEEKPIEQLSRIITLKHDATSFDFRDEIGPLARDISGKAKHQKLKFRTIGIIAITDQLKMKNRAFTLDKETDDEKVVMKIVSELFAKFFNEEDSIVRRAGIRVSGLVKKSEKPASDGTSSLADYL